jgi:putative phosphoribosyl transferase
MTKLMEQQDVHIASGGHEIEGNLVVPPGARGLVIFAHGSGSSRFSPRNRYVAEVLQEREIGTLLLDLLTMSEQEDDEWNGRLRFDIDLLTSRLVAATAWALSNPATRLLPMGYFGASTGAAAALKAAAERRQDITSVVSRGGRPDLAGDSLLNVKAPTLLIVGEEDKPVIEMNEWAFERIAAADKKMILVPGATHLFSEPGTLEKVADLAAGWFYHHLRKVIP